MRINPINKTNYVAPIFKITRNNQKRKNDSLITKYKAAYIVDISQSALEFLKLLNSENNLVYDSTIQSYTRDLKLIKK
jgi:hypothetical protein